jgi:DDE_Tnp_1-associated
MNKDLTARFSGLVDLRVTRRCDHWLIDILVIAVSAVIAYAASWEDIELYGRSKQAWLKAFLALPNYAENIPFAELIEWPSANLY